MPAVAVQQGELAGRLEQALLVVLPVDLAQPRPDRREPTDRHRSIVEASR